jgi:hypothetical protein
MSSVHAIDARLRKLEARRPRKVTFFLAWAETDEKAQQALERFRAAGALRPREAAVALSWRCDEPMPASGRRDPESLSKTEHELLLAHLEALAARQERETAIAAGEDIRGLDETDFYIRHLRRHGKHDDLRMLGFHRVPSPALHGMPCACETCARGETTPAGHTAWQRRHKAWMARYLPDENRQRGATYADTRH